MTAVGSPARISMLLMLCVMATAAKCPFGGTRNETKIPVARNAAIPDSADQVLFGLRTILNDQGVMKGILLSDTAFTYEDGNRLELTRVNLTFYTAQGARDGVMTSRAGTYNSRLQRLEARGDVIVRQDDGKTLTTPKLVYDQARNQIFTDTSFVLVEPTKQVSGIGFESDPKLTLFRCLRACKAIAPVRVPVR